ncbi:putative uncharacterized protein [Parachlamydia acanthamoebae UV-7]|uniref:Potassium channel domain-containing protein n=2 Tax=Parachlamydia acanthamoebae TaxID=83552 RepID=F8KV65_PARAV|nr:hypothetical protein [Parachlamydia acanthamoebae]CCB87587.1 putative uncharacterized protein [Parachlamydia acanthamoebae UV-7]
MYEHAKSPLLPRRAFYLRLLRNLVWAMSFISFSLCIGMMGYHHFEKMPWIDSFANAAMILSGMGPLGAIQTSGGKLFAGFYALYSGLAFIFALGLIFAPIFHRFLHKFHLEEIEANHKAKSAKLNSNQKG